jgi:hypothetical protein
MSSTDRSQTERIRRIRAQIQAVRREECAACLEEGPQGPVDQSTRTSRKFGQMIYYKQNASGVVTPTGCCSSVSSGCPVNFDALNALAIQLDGFPVIKSFTINGSTITLTSFEGEQAQLNLYFVTSASQIDFKVEGVYANASSGPITLALGPALSLTLEPCGAFVAGTS